MKQQGDDTSRLLFCWHHLSAGSLGEKKKPIINKWCYSHTCVHTACIEIITQAYLSFASGFKKSNFLSVFLFISISRSKIFDLLLCQLYLFFKCVLYRHLTVCEHISISTGQMVHIYISQLTPCVMVSIKSGAQEPKCLHILHI